MDDINSNRELPTEFMDAKIQLGEHQDLRKNILELSMETLSKGQILLEKLREASSRADLNSRHAAKSACYGIERTLEALQGRRRKLEEVWKHRKKMLEQCVRSCKLDEEIKKVRLLSHIGSISAVCLYAGVIGIVVGLHVCFALRVPDSTSSFPPSSK